MGWIIESLTLALLSLVAGFIGFLMDLCVKFELDIGYDPTKTDASLFDYSFFSKDTALKGLFDEVFPNAHAFMNVFIILGYVLVLAIIVLKLMQGMTGPLSGSGENPFMLLTRGLVALFLVTWSYTIFVMMEKFANSIYGLFKDVYLNISASNSIDLTSFVTDPRQFIGDGTVVAFPLDGLLMFFISLILFGALLIQFAALTLEIFERYVMLGLLFYTCPLAFACYTSKPLGNILNSWIKMVCSLFITLFLNLFVMGVFVSGMYNVFTIGPGESSLFDSTTDYLVRMLVLIGWLTVGQKVDEVLRSLGLSVARTGQGLKSALYGAYKLVQAGKNATNALTKPIAKAGSKLNQEHKNKLQAAAEINKKQQSARQVTEGAEIGSNGMHTQKGAVDIMKSGAPVDGVKAENIAKQLGVDLAKDTAHCIAGDGLITSIGSNGVINEQVGLQNRFKTKDGIAAEHISTPAGSMVKPLTTEALENHNKSIGAALNGTGTLTSGSLPKDVEWKQQPDGTWIGTGKADSPNAGIKYDLTTAGLAEHVFNGGPIHECTTSDGTTFTYQERAGGNETGGAAFSSVYRPASSEDERQLEPIQADKGAQTTPPPRQAGPFTRSQEFHQNPSNAGSAYTGSGVSGNAGSSVSHSVNNQNPLRESKTEIKATDATERRSESSRKIVNERKTVTNVVNETRKEPNIKKSDEKAGRKFTRRKK